MIQDADEFIDERDAETLAICLKATQEEEERGPDDVLEAVRESMEGYTIYGVMGAGGQGRVYSGLRESTSHDVAIKVLHGVLCASRRETRRFLREL